MSTCPGVSCPCDDPIFMVTDLPPPAPPPPQPAGPEGTVVGVGGEVIGEGGPVVGIN